jgi:DNA repair protein RadD
LYGLDPGQAEEMVKKAQPTPLRKRSPSEPFLIQPQREWEEARKRVYEQAQRLAKLLLNHVELSMTGTELIYKYTSLNVTGKNNYVSALMMVNAEINKRLGKERPQANTDEFKQILDSLEDILQTLARRVRKAKSEYEQNKA